MNPVTAIAQNFALIVGIGIPLSLYCGAIFWWHMWGKERRANRNSRHRRRRR